MEACSIALRNIIEIYLVEETTETGKLILLPLPPIKKKTLIK